MDPVLTRLSQLEADARAQKDLNGAQQDAIARLHSDVARLSSENANLRTTVHDQARVIADISNLAVPEGFWVCESSLAGDRQVDAGGRAMARWVWSSVSPRSLLVRGLPCHHLTASLLLCLDRHQEKYASAATATASASGAPATLLSLPVELLNAVIDHLHPADRKTLFFVCYRILVVASPHVFSARQRFNASQATRYIKARVSLPFSFLSVILLPARDLTSLLLSRNAGQRFTS